MKCKMIIIEDLLLINEYIESEVHDVENEKLQSAINTLKESGVRITPQRHAVLEYLLTSMTHPTADDIYKALESKFPNMSVATVYNNLRILSEIGLVRELAYGDDSSRYDSNMDDHYHIVCEDCGKVVDFHYPTLHEIESLAQRVSGFEIEEHRLELYGKCKDCKTQKEIQH